MSFTQVRYSRTGWHTYDTLLRHSEYPAMFPLEDYALFSPQQPESPTTHKWGGWMFMGGKVAVLPVARIFRPSFYYYIPNTERVYALSRSVPA